MKTDPSGRDPDAAITARAREATKELFDEDIVRPELEFDEASFNLFAGLITAALCAVRETIQPEVCICAAIKLADERVIRGHRHDDCIQTAIKWKAEYKDSEQGFVTSRNRFVGRKEAMELQKAAGIASRDGYRGNILFSEDLY